MVQIINLTAEAVTILTPEGPITFEPSGNKAEVRWVHDEFGFLPSKGGNVPMAHSELSVELPKFEPGTYYIVTQDVAQLRNVRSDLLIPYGRIHNVTGELIGYHGLTEIVNFGMIRPQWFALQVGAVAKS